jgi:hypothetical protein
MTFRLLSLKTLFLALAVVSVSGCATVKGKFKSTKEANVGFFADQTIAMLSSADFGLDRQRTIYIREFFDENGTEEKRFVELTNAVETALRGVVRYSIAIVTIAETEKTEIDRIKAYVKYLKGIQHDAEKRLKLEPGHYDQILARVEKQDQFISAIQQAQPIINAVGRYIQTLVDEIYDAAEVLEKKLDNRIDDEYAEVIRYQQSHNREKYLVLTGLNDLYDAYQNDESAFKRLIQSDAIRNKKLIPHSVPTEEELSQIGKYLLKRLEVMHKIWQEIEPDWQLYRKTHRELDENHIKVLEDTNRLRITMIVWLRAHQKMAAGITNPAEWFNVEEAPTELFKLGTKAVF